MPRSLDIAIDELNQHNTTTWIHANIGLRNIRTIKIFKVAHIDTKYYSLPRIFWVVALDNYKSDNKKQTITPKKKKKKPNKGGQMLFDSTYHLEGSPESMQLKIMKTSILSHDSPSLCTLIRAVRWMDISI